MEGSKNFDQYFSPSGVQKLEDEIEATQEMDMRGTKLEVVPDQEEQVQETVSDGIEYLLRDNPNAPETIDAVNEFVVKNADNLTDDDLGNYIDLIEERKDGDPAKRREALRAMYVIEDQRIKAFEDQRKGEAENIVEMANEAFPDVQKAVDEMVKMARQVELTPSLAAEVVGQCDGFLDQIEDATSEGVEEWKKYLQELRTWYLARSDKRAA